MSKKNKKQIVMVVALLLLVCTGVGYVFASRYVADKEAKEEAANENVSSVEICSYDAEDIVRISFIGSTGSMVLENDDEVWVNAADEDFPVDQDIASTMAEKVAAVSTEKIVNEDGKDKADYGLEEPDLSIDVTMADGENYSLYIGEDSSAVEGCFAYTSLSDRIFIIDSSVPDAFDYSEKQLIDIEDIPAITADYVTHIRVSGRKMNHIFEADYDENNSQSKDIYGWDITSPFKETVAGDIYQLSELFGNYTSLSFAECTDYTGKHEKKYGLDKPAYIIDLNYYEVETQESDDEEEQEEKHIPYTYHLEIGKQDASGEYYYVRPEDSKRVYLMEASMAEALLPGDAFQYIYANMYLGTVYTLNTIDMKADGKAYHMTLERHETKTEQTEGEDGENEESDITFTAKIDGKEVDEEAFRMAYGSAGALSYNGVIDENMACSDTPVYQFTFTEEERTVKLKFLPYDEKNYRVDVDGQMLFVTEKEAVDNFVNGFLELIEK